MGTLDSSMEERISIWDAGMALFKQNPFWGEGPLTYMHSYPRIHAPYHEHAHSLYIDTILSYGIVGTILLSFVFCCSRSLDDGYESGVGETSDYRSLSIFPYSGCCARNL